MKGFALLSNMMLPLMLLLPMILIRYYYELHQMIMLNYYQMIFYSIGSYVFTLPLTYLSYMLLKAPIESLLNIGNEVQMVRTG